MNGPEHGNKKSDGNTVPKEQQGMPFQCVDPIIEERVDEEKQLEPLSDETGFDSDELLGVVEGTTVILLGC